MPWEGFPRCSWRARASLVAVREEGLSRSRDKVARSERAVLKKSDAHPLEENDDQAQWVEGAVDEATMRKLWHGAEALQTRAGGSWHGVRDPCKRPLLQATPVAGGFSSPQRCTSPVNTNVETY